MKTLLLSISFMLLAWSISAQRGLEAGAIIQPQIYTQIYSETPADVAMKIPYSFAIGVDLGFNFTDQLGIRTGLLYTPMGERFNDLTTDPEERIDLNLNYIQAPLYLKYNSNPDNKFSLLVIAGGYIGYLNEALRSVDDDNAVGVLGDYKRIMPGISFGIGTQINLDRGGNINILWRSSLSIDTVQVENPISRNFATGFQLAYHYFLWQPR